MWSWPRGSARRKQLWQDIFQLWSISFYSIWLWVHNSFISKRFFELAHLDLKQLENTLTISKPEDKFLSSTHTVKASHVTVSDELRMDDTLIVLYMQNFDVILGMDCLGENHALIDCEVGLVSFKLFLSKTLVYKEVASQDTPRVITALKDKLIVCGCFSTKLPRLPDLNQRSQLWESTWNNELCRSPNHLIEWHPQN